MFYPAIYGAYIEFWAAIAPDLTSARSGAYIHPWRRFGYLPAGIEAFMKEKSE